MLQENEVVRIRRVLEKMYEDTCTIERYKPQKNAQHITTMVASVDIADVPCKLTYESNKATRESASASKVLQTIKLFMSPDISVAAGSKITVVHLGQSTVYKSSGKPAVYPTHQEIVLELGEAWA